MFRALSRIHNGKFKHIALGHEYIRQLFSDTLTKDNLVDTLTKGLLSDLSTNRVICSKKL